MHSTSGARTKRVMFNTVVVAAAVATSACNSDGGRATDRRTAGATTGAVDSSAAQVTAAVPKLPKKIGAITPDEFVNAIKGVTWLGHVVERRCRGLGCRPTPGGNSTLVLHEAAAGANNQKFGAGLPDEGVVISRMRNLGNRPESLYNLPRGNTEWYLVLTRSSSDTTARLKLVGLDYDAHANPQLDSSRAAMTIIRCSDGNPNPHPTADAGFKPCDTKPDTAPPFALPTSFNRGAWFTCSLGCCTTGAVPPFGGDSTAGDSARLRQRPR
jgi:hypothetical protein